MLKLGENLRKLRREKELTQEELADVFSVSPQAISRWEKGATYPDITLLPTIANLFGVTLDDLMGMEELRDEKRLDEIMNKYAEYGSKGLIEECIALVRTELKNYPNNYDLLTNLAVDLFRCQTKDGKEISDEDHLTNVREAIEISERILAGCSDSVIRNDISCLICYLYDSVGDDEKAVKYAEKLPNAWSSSTIVLGNLYKGDKRKLHLQWTVAVGLEMIHQALQGMADLDYKDKTMTTAERIEILQKSLEIHKTIYDKGDYLFYSIRLSESHRSIAAMNMLEGDYEAAIYNLEMAAKYAIMYDTLPESAMHTSLPVNMIEYKRIETSKNYSFSKCAELYNKMQWDRYDAIRSDERFTAIIERIKAYI